MNRGVDMGAYDRGQTRRFALIGMLGGFICSIADYFLEYLGALPNETLGAYGVVETAWASMAAWRFPASIWIAAVTVPMYVLGFIAIARQMRSTHERLGKLFGASALLGSLGGLFIHIMLCVLPVAYQHLIVNGSQTLAVGTIDAMVGSFIVPFYAYYVFLIIIPLIAWCVYCFRKGGLYKPVAAIAVVGFTVVCLVLGGIVPSLGFLQVGAVSRMIGLWCMTAWLTERKAERNAI